MDRVILYDGYCNLCNSSIKFIISHDQKKLYRYVALQSNEGQKYLQQNGLSLKEFDSVILIEDNKLYTASTAALMIAKNLSGIVRYLYVFIYIPSFIRDAVYNFIAKNRYRVFGRSKECKIDS